MLVARALAGDGGFVGVAFLRDRGLVCLAFLRDSGCVLRELLGDGGLVRFSLSGDRALVRSEFRGDSFLVLCEFCAEPQFMSVEFAGESGLVRVLLIAEPGFMRDNCGAERVVLSVAFLRKLGLMCLALVRDPIAVRRQLSGELCLLLGAGCGEFRFVTCPLVRALLSRPRGEPLLLACGLVGQRRKLCAMRFKLASDRSIVLRTLLRTAIEVRLLLKRDATIVLLPFRSQCLVVLLTLLSDAAAQRLNLGGECAPLRVHARFEFSGALREALFELSLFTLAFGFELSAGAFALADEARAFLLGFPLALLLLACKRDSVLLSLGAEFLSGGASLGGDALSFCLSSRECGLCFAVRTLALSARFTLGRASRELGRALSFVEEAFTLGVCRGVLLGRIGPCAGNEDLSLFRSGVQELVSASLRRTEYSVALFLRRAPQLLGVKICLRHEPLCMIFSNLKAFFHAQPEARVAAGAELGDLFLQLCNELALFLPDAGGLLMRCLQRIDMRLQSADMAGESLDSLIDFFAVVPTERRGERLDCFGHVLSGIWNEGSRGRAGGGGAGLYGFMIVHIPWRRVEFAWPTEGIPSFCACLMRKAPVALNAEDPIACTESGLR